MKLRTGGQRSQSSEVLSALQACRQAVGGIAVFSAIINILMLSGSLYMLQVCDRVLSSRSISTLVGISLILLAAYILQGSWIRCAPRCWLGSAPGSTNSCRDASSISSRRCPCARSRPTACNRSATSTTFAGSCPERARRRFRHAVHAGLFRLLFPDPPVDRRDEREAGLSSSRSPSSPR